MGLLSYKFTVGLLIYLTFGVVGVLSQQVNGITGKVFTYEDTSKACRRFGAAMSREGISRGDVVIFYAQNCPEYIICALGVIGLGASISTVNPSYTVNELVKQVSVLPDKTNIILTTSHLLPVIKEAESILNRERNTECISLNEKYT